MVYTCETLYNQQDEAIGDYNGEWFNHQDDFFDIDTPISCIEANMSRRSSTRYPPRPKKTHAGRSAEAFQSPKVTMPWERWKQLENDARATGDTLDDRDKAIILGSPPLTEHSSSNEMIIKQPNISTCIIFKNSELTENNSMIRSNYQ
jgi:hypothetical protein